MHRQPELFEGQLGRGRAATCELPRAACELPRAATCCCRLLPPVLTGRTFEPPFLYETNVEIGVVIKASDAAEVEELRARFPIELAPDAAFATSAASRGYVLARGPTDGDNGASGLQMRWRVRCNDVSYLPAWRLFLFYFWHTCSRCGEKTASEQSSVQAGYSSADIQAAEAHALAGTGPLCADCSREDREEREA